MINAATSLLHRALLMVLYSTGMRRAEVTCVKVSDIDSQRMLIHIKQGKGGKDRDVPLSPKLLETLRETGDGRSPGNISFPARLNKDQTASIFPAKRFISPVKELHAEPASRKRSDRTH
jgi:integrase/recombinase XerD